MSEQLSRDRVIFTAIGHLQQLADVFQRRREQLAKSVGLTEQEWAVLEEVATDHFIPSMFARSRDSSMPAVSRILRQLQDKSLISASISDADARSRNYALTGVGKKVMEKIREERRIAIASVWSDLDEGELHTFNRFAAELLARLEGYASAVQRRASSSRNRTSAHTL